jgi:hypothetical protein
MFSIITCNSADRRSPRRSVLPTPYWLTDFFEGNAVAEVTPEARSKYVESRGRVEDTVRRELGVLRAAINYAYKSGRITHPVTVELPERPEPRDRWLTRIEAAQLIRAARTAHDSTFHCSFSWASTLAGAKKRFFHSAGRKWTLRSVGLISRSQAAGGLIKSVASSKSRRVFCLSRDRSGLCAAHQWRAHQDLPPPVSVLVSEGSRLTR